MSDLPIGLPKNGVDPAGFENRTWDQFSEPPGWKGVVEAASLCRKIT